MSDKELKQYQQQLEAFEKKVTKSKSASRKFLVQQGVITPKGNLTKRYQGVLCHSARPGLILAFHGTDKTIAEEIVAGKKELTFYKNDYDWLGHGAYFWDNSPSRALQFAQLLHANPKRAKIKITTPAVLGAVINLGNCLDFTDYQNLQLLRQGYSIVEKIFDGKIMPINKGGDDLLMRDLDCLVIETLHEAVGQDKFDSVRGVFWEGKDVYPTAGFKEKNHIQICIRNPNCIKGYFLPRNNTAGYREI